MSATLKGARREKPGSRHARRLRLQGRIPACLQGEGQENLDIHIQETEFLTARRHHEHLFDIELEDGHRETALIKELQWSALGDRIMHVEFRRVVRDRKTEVDVELEFIGHPKGGVLNHLVTHVTISAVPTAIPDSIEVRVDELEEGHPIFARDLKLPEGVDLAIPADTQIAVVSHVRAEEVEAPAEAAEGEAEAAEGAEPAEKKEEEES